MERRAAIVSGASSSPAEGPAPEPPGRSEARRHLLGPAGAALAAAAARAHAEARAEGLPREALGLFLAEPPDGRALAALGPALRASRDADGCVALPCFYAAGLDHLHPLTALVEVGNAAAGALAEELDLRGEHALLHGRGAAGARALAEALEALRRGGLRLALAGAADGLGAAVLGLEVPASARARGAPVLGWLLGHGYAFPGPEEPLEAAADRAERAALADAGWGPGAAPAPGAGPPARVPAGRGAADAARAVLAALAVGSGPGPRRALITALGPEGAAALVVEGVACAS